MILEEERRLVAVLVRPWDENEVAPGQWHLEVGFGRIDGLNHPAFADLAAVQDRISQHLAR